MRKEGVKFIVMSIIKSTYLRVYLAFVGCCKIYRSAEIEQYEYTQVNSVMRQVSS